MNETRKRHSLWWIWIIVLLVVFVGGTVFGLWLYGQPTPAEFLDRVLNKVQAADTAVPVPTAEIPAPPEEAPAAVTEAPVPPAEEPAAVTEAPVPAAEQPADAVKAPAPETQAPAPAAEETPSGAYIGVPAAQEAALAWAKVSEADAEITGVVRTKDDDGNAVYEVSFRFEDTDYACVIDAFTGELLSYQKNTIELTETDPAPGPTPLDAFDNVGVETDAEPEKKAEEAAA